MKNWTEFHISIIYFTGLLVALGSSILTIFYLRPIKKTIEKITKGIDFFWDRSFKTTIILAGLLGAMSVSFRNCSGNYTYLLESRKETIAKGFEQVSASFNYLTIILGLWLIIFLILQLMGNKHKMPGVHKD
ncbi:MAG TPA: hypothetical protein VE978_11790 [Chitinophagales bacterium]|nr:hypothetical protein [Chitinophagales bacterium]